MFDESTLDAMDVSLARFRKERVIFELEGVCPDGISLPRQHSLGHYRRVIELFGALNGLCSSITESKHIKAIKEPWKRSNHYKALGQMLITNQHLEKLAASRVNFTVWGMLAHPLLHQSVVNATDAEHLAATDWRDHSGTVVGSTRDDDDVVAIAGPHISAEVTLAKCPGASFPPA
jgi:hypothetical protein